MEFPCEAKAENSQNVSFPANRDKIPMESIPKSFDTDSCESILDGVASCKAENKITVVACE